MSDTDFAQHALAVAELFWGEPNKRMSSASEVRWGAQGSKAIDPKKGTWFDYENQVGGGVIDLVVQERACSKAEAVRWLETEGFIEARGRQERDEKPPAKVEQQDDGGKFEIVETYDYTSGDGDLLYQACRVQWRLPDGTWRMGKKGKIAKTFIQRRPLPNNEWLLSLEGGDFMRRAGSDTWRHYKEEYFRAGMERRTFDAGVQPHALYRLQQLELAIEAGRTVLVVEGERKVYAAERLGFAATCNSGGAKKFHDLLLPHFKGAHVVILADNDPAGIAHANMVARKLRPYCASVRVGVLPGGEKQDIVDWEAAGGTAEQLKAFVEGLELWSPAMTPLPPSSFGAATLRGLATSKIVYDWLIKGMVERGGVMIVAGEKSAGKSFFMIDMGMKIARGLDYGDRKVKQGLVIHVACEDGRGVQLRAEGYRRDNDIPDTENVPFIVMDRNFSLMDDESIAKFIAECKTWEAYFDLKLELIIIDTLSRATEGLDEIQSGEVGKVLGRVNRIAAETESAVCLVHHMNARGERVRGHSSLTANVGQVIEIRQMTEFQTHRNAPIKLIRDSDGRVVRQAILEKNKNGEDDKKWRFVLRRIVLGKDDDNFDISTCVLERPSSDVREDAEPKNKLTAEQKLVLDALQAALEDESIDMPRGVRVGGGIKKAVSDKAFVARVRKTWSFSAAETEVEARNRELTSALRRIVTALQNGGYIGRDNDHHVLWDLGKTSRRRSSPPPQETEPTADIEAPF